MRTYPLGAATELALLRGDITTLAVDAIVNAANSRLLGGGGVDGAIHRRAGPKLLDACRALPEVAPGVRCLTGEARMTPGFDLPARHVIHAVGPVYGDAGSATLLANAHRASLGLAIEAGFATIAFPAISCGVYGYPVEEAAPIALTACREHGQRLERITFALFDDHTLGVFERAAQRLFPPRGS
jgi:O-acetyl-ADP-ribose deacetylase (regulator of RNase III)